ncbi:hypothetical protein O181_073431 [Austropuccinia psidii MF-1]|uniref:Uncharacterized protein n=1 Tax=Austropuccinia psidii MF-1 TaxID=1389203 RepID=A0A9Q3F4L5_9BASI|nr:hypothetical protein [Austropuccinia psidii MF-1]
MTSAELIVTSRRVDHHIFGELIITSGERRSFHMERSTAPGGTIKSDGPKKQEHRTKATKLQIINRKWPCVIHLAQNIDVLNKKRTI